MYTLDDFLDLAEKLILLFDDLTDIEQTKLEAVTEKNIDSLNECMKEEQAYLLQFRGLDKKREAIQRNFQKLFLWLKIKNTKKNWKNCLPH